MPALTRDLSQVEVQAFPPWLDLPPGYIVNDWIAWQKGKLVAQRLREHPEDVQHGINWLKRHEDRLSAHDLEWLQMLQNWPLSRVADLLEAGDDEGQRLRSGMPFKGEPFVSSQQMEAIRERAYCG